LACKARRPRAFSSGTEDDGHANEALSVVLLGPDDARWLRRRRDAIARNAGADEREGG
jgi:hypothetical protein